jgi:hypothetical protein
MSTFVDVATSPPLKASSEKGDGWREWADGGFAAHLLISRKMSRMTYVSALQGLLEMVVRIQQKYPDLYAVLKVRRRIIVQEGGCWSGLGDDEDGTLMAARQIGQQLSFPVPAHSLPVVY